MDDACKALAQLRPWRRQYEKRDNRQHRTHADAPGNMVLTAVFAQFDALRRAVVSACAQKSLGQRPVSHHCFAQHDRLIEALTGGGASAAEQALRDPLLFPQSVVIGLARPLSNMLSWQHPTFRSS